LDFFEMSLESAVTVY